MGQNLLPTCWRRHCRDFGLLGCASEAEVFLGRFYDKSGLIRFGRIPAKRAMDSLGQKLAFMYYDVIENFPHLKAGYVMQDDGLLYT